MMLREGWDVRGVTVVLGLRPFTAHAEILPEQVIGRGLRLMVGIGPDRTQTLEVLGTRKLLEVLKGQLEAEGVGVATTKKGSVPPVIIAPIAERLKFDIAIPITKPRLIQNVKKLEELNPENFKPIYEQQELEETYRLQGGPCECKHTVFNYVATYNGFERRFAKFLDSASDVLEETIRIGPPAK
jgi:type III restriction enzyme